MERPVLVIACGALAHEILELQRLGGWRHVSVTERRTKLDWAFEVRGDKGVRNLFHGFLGRPRGAVLETGSAWRLEPPVGPGRWLRLSGRSDG